jgi:hypothetical protein
VNNIICREKGTIGYEFSPLPVALDAHGMAAVGQHHLAIHLHANAALVLSFNINLRNLPDLSAVFIIPPSVPLGTNRLLAIAVADPIMQLH